MSLLIFALGALTGAGAGLVLGSAWENHQRRLRRREVRELLERKRKLDRR